MPGVGYWHSLPLPSHSPSTGRPGHPLPDQQLNPSCFPISCTKMGSPSQPSIVSAKSSYSRVQVVGDQLQGSCSCEVQITCVLWTLNCFLSSGGSGSSSSRTLKHKISHCQTLPVVGVGSPDASVSNSDACSLLTQFFPLSRHLHSHCCGSCDDVCGLPGVLWSHPGVPVPAGNGK